MLKFLLEFGPVIIFFIGYKTGAILDATLYMLVASFISIGITYIREKKINTISLLSSVILLTSCSLTLISGNSIFIKIKPTVLYCLFAIIFFITTFKYKPAIQLVLGNAISFKEEISWQYLNLRFMWFFLFMAILNEIIWRNCAESTWVNFKVFGALSVTIAFILSQVSYILKNSVPNKEV